MTTRTRPVSYPVSLTIKLTGKTADAFDQCCEDGDPAHTTAMVALGRNAVC